MAELEPTVPTGDDAAPASSETPAGKSSDPKAPKTKGKKEPARKKSLTKKAGEPSRSAADASTPTVKKKKKASIAAAADASATDHEASVPGAIGEDKKQTEVAVHLSEVGDEPEPISDPVSPMPAEELREQEEMEFPTEVITESPTPKLQAEPLEVDEYENRDFDNLNPKDYGIDFDEKDMVYEPPDRDDTLPDLYRLMDSLDDGGGDLEGDMEPPSLFTQPEHVPNYKKISELKLELEEEELDPYLEQFEDGIRDDVLMIGSIALEEVQEEELRLRDEHIAYQDQEAAIARQQKQEIVTREEEAKRRVAQDLKEKRRLLRRRQELLQQKERLMMDRLHKSFRRAENQLCSVLENRKGEVKTMFGDLTLGEGHYGGNRGRRWKVDWDSTPQPVQIKLKTLRGIKDKLPGGRYVLSVSMYNRLGGHVMRWSNLKGQQWGGTTLPLQHDGHFYNAEIKIDQSVFTVLPSRPGIRPGMTLVFELFLLRGAVLPTDRVVAWGCFPIADAKFDVIEGKFKAPFLRGEMDVKIDKHDKLEELMSMDMDNWMSNLYFEIIKLPRYLAGQKEYEVELQFSSALLNFPDRYNTNGEEYRDGEAPLPGSLPDVNVAAENKENLALENRSSSGSQLNIRPTTSDNSDSSDIRKPLGSYYDLKRPSSSSGDSLGSNLAITQGGGVRKRPMTTIGSRAIHKKKVMIGEESDSDEYDEEDVYVGKAGDGFFPVKGHAGMYYKQYRTNAVDDYHRKLYTLLPKTPLLTKRLRRKRLTYLEQLEEHTYSVKEPFSDKGHMQEVSKEKMQYVGRQLLAELGLSQWRSREFWTMITMFVLIWFVRIYAHYIGQWIFLQARVIPINKFVFYPYTVNLNYQPTLLNAAEEAAVVLLGPFTNIFILVFFVFVCWVIQRIFGNFPDIGSKFIVVYGIHTFLDPFLIALVDTALQRWQDVGGDVPIGDYAKVYWNFYRSEGTGIAGIFLTVFMYICTCFAAGTITYMYFLRLHNNGRMLDIYWRLHGEEEVFFVPYDLEISNQELDYIVRKAEQWRGEEGERRKIAVYDYIWEEETIEETIWDENGDEKKEIREGKQEVTTHVAIHTLHLDGLRELYRHFLRLPDGAIVEVFGDMTVTGMDKDITSALTEGVNEDLGSQTNLSKVPGRETAYTNAGFNLEDDDDHIVKRPSPSAGSISSLKKMS